MNLITAADIKWGIGRDGGLLASLPADMKYFRDHTMGKVVVMGRRTLESLPGGRGLPGRTNYVMTSNPGFKAERCITVSSEDDLWQELSQYDTDDVFLIGGSTVYNQFYKLCDRLYVTKIEADLNADTFIVNLDEDPDFEIASESEPVTENGITYRFVIYGRRAQGSYTKQEGSETDE